MRKIGLWVVIVLAPLISGTIGYYAAAWQSRRLEEAKEVIRWLDLRQLAFKKPTDDTIGDISRLGAYEQLLHKTGDALPITDFSASDELLKLCLVRHYYLEFHGLEKLAQMEWEIIRKRFPRESSDDAIRSIEAAAVKSLE